MKTGTGEDEIEKRSCRGEQKKQEGVISQQARSGVSEGPSYEEIQAYEIHGDPANTSPPDISPSVHALQDLIRVFRRVPGVESESVKTGTKDVVF
jgi:hypothetical protein